jgi:hypothetical protein
VVNSVFSIDIAAPSLTEADVRALVRRDVVLGEPAKDWWSGQKEGTRRRFAREMRLGIGRGETTEQLIHRVRGKSTGRSLLIELPSGKSKRVKEFAGGIMDVSRDQADALVRTSAQSVSNKAMMETYEANDDIIKGYEALTTLDGQTSPICMARTGAAWYTNGEPFPESSVQEGFPGPPPWHFKCRTSLNPVTYSWDELMERASGKKQGLLDTVPDSQRASMDGLLGTGQVKTFDDWLRIKGDPFARQKLGPGLFDLWKDGKITMPQLIDAGGNPRTLAELKRLAS